MLSVIASCATSAAQCRRSRRSGIVFAVLTSSPKSNHGLSLTFICEGTKALMRKLLAASSFRYLLDLSGQPYIWIIMIARNILIEGKVQGVYFREWAVRTAQELDVVGWVRNLNDGRIEIYAVGDAGSIERFIKRLHDGSPASEVNQVVVQDTPVEKLHSFMRRQSA